MQNSSKRSAESVLPGTDSIELRCELKIDEEYFSDLAIESVRLISNRFIPKTYSLSTGGGKL